MATILTKYSDYTIHSINFFIEKIENELALRDVPNLTATKKVENIPVLKEHPLVILTLKTINTETRNAADFESGVIPSIAVTPGDMPETGFTFAKGYKSKTVDDTLINYLKTLLDKTNKEIHQDGLITKQQIELILSEYRRNQPGDMLIETKEYHKDEQVNISVWGMSPDITNMLTSLVDSILTEIQIGDLGDGSEIKNMKIGASRGLNNIRFGRTLFGTEFNLTFTNTFTNNTIKVDKRITECTFDTTFRTPGDQQ